jgi:hypothetical protein
MSEIDTMTTLNDQSTQELRAAADAIGAGDDLATRFAGDVRKALDTVNSASRRAAGEAARLHADDVMNPDGKRRLLSELPASLKAATVDQLGQAETALSLIEDLHIGRILRHDPRNDGALIAELGNYCANLKPTEAVAALVQLAANTRYSTILSGAMGASLGARFNFDPAILEKTALQALAVNGTEDQIRRSRALAAIPSARRALGLAKAGRDHVASEAPKPPRPKTAPAGLMG